MSLATTTQTQRSPKARKTQAAPPLSPAAAKLIAQVQAEAREQLLNELSAKDTITVLHGFDAETKRVFADGNNLTISDKSGNELHMYRYHNEPEIWSGKAHMKGYWNPARWYGRQTLVDALGNEWDHKLNPHVCDDFGNLVEVPR